MSFGDKMREIEQRAQDAAAPGKKNQAGAWEDAKTDVGSAGEVEPGIE